MCAYVSVCVSFREFMKTLGIIIQLMNKYLSIAYRCLSI